MAEFDIAVVGGGINGTGIARAAAYRGYRTILFEKDDFAESTTSQTTKMIHGGIRYLETGDFHLVWESLRERWTLLHIAPHLVKAIELVIPAYKTSVRPPWMIRLGTLLYDLLAGRRNIGKSHSLSKEEIAAIPGLDKEGLRAAIAYPDGQVFDSRLCLETALSARDAGAVVLNHHPVEKVELKDGTYTLSGRDLRTGKPFRYTANCVANVTGPWTPFFEKATQHHEPKPMVYDRGIHLVIPSLGVKQGLALMASDRRLIFVLPWQDDFTLVGTTETPFDGKDFSHVPPSEEEITYLMDALNGFFPERHLKREEVLYVYAGVRTLIAGHETSLTRLSREAEIQVFSDAPGTAWVMVYGGKLTSYRALSEHALDALKPHLPARPGTALRFTDKTPLYGGAEIVEIPRANIPPFLTRELSAAWQRRYGSNWAELVDLALAKPALQELLLPRFQFTRADLVYMVTEELAHTLEDITLRRTKMIYTLTPKENRMLAQELKRVQQGKAHAPHYGESGG